MSDNENMFGGKPKKGNALYVPMSDIEQECLLRIAELDGYRIRIKDYGVISQAHTIVGDKRLSFKFTLSFDRPETPIPLYWIDLELLAFGEVVFSERQSVVYGGQPTMVMAGVQLQMVWDIAIKHIEPRIVKNVIGALGLTSRLQDKDSGEFTLTGNMTMTGNKRETLHKLKAGEEKVRAASQEQFVSQVTKAKKHMRDNAKK